MANISNQGYTAAQTPSCGCAPAVCPDCGGLECLCRPRFFAGQLLTDEDLTRLDYYITAKNKLHNRYLVGWGVVCGMEVVCGCANGTVTVSPGYALSPCGEDIVVCSPASVDVCSLIQKCMKAQPRNCGPTQQNPANDPCNNATEKWILSIHYDETMSRGVVPLKNTGSACCSKCACGGSSSCSCGSRSSSSMATSSGSGNGGCGCGSSTTATPSASPQCEPTVVCEGYRFEVCKVKTTTEATAPPGAIVQRFLCCFTALKGLVSAPPTDPTALQAWCCAIRDNLLDFFAANPGYDCSVLQKLAVLCSAQADPATVVSNVVLLLAQFIENCLCSLALPPCPCPVEDAAVPLATITVSKTGGVCSVVSICNFDARKFVTTFPNLFYWFSAFPTLRDIRNILTRLCCTPLKGMQLGIREGEQLAFVRTANEPSAAALVSSTATKNGSVEFSQLAALAYARRSNPVDAQTLSMATLGVQDANQAPLMSDAELAHPFETLLLNQVAMPLLQMIVPTLGTNTALLAGLRTAAAPTAAAPAAPASQTDLSDQVAQLKSSMADMQAQIAKLTKGKK
jgi:hypothetical protein